MPSFTQADIIATTRRMVKIPRENAGLDMSISSSDKSATDFLAVDTANSKFMDTYSQTVSSYELELLNLNGNVSPSYTNTDISNAAQMLPGNIFFPSGYQLMTPLVGNFTTGIFYPTSVNPNNESTILPTLSTKITWLNTGISSGTNQLSTGTLFSNLLTTPVQMQVGDCLISNGTYSGRYYIVSSTLNMGLYDNVISSLLPSSNNMTNPTIYQSVSAFTPTERQNLTSSIFQEYLTNLTNGITTDVNTWLGYLTAILGYLNSNNDTRSVPQSNILAAKSNVNSAISSVNNWLALSNTGVNGKFTSTNIGTLSTAIGTRTTFIGTRIGQITTDLGSNQSGALADPNNPYAKKQSWLDKRINRVYGSLTRYYAAINAKNSAQSLKDNNTSLFGEYSNFFVAKALAANDGSSTLQLTDNTGFNLGDSVHILSETLPVINATILAILGTTQIKISQAIPVTYTVDDIARVYKTL